jgi:hypothetical protein
LGISGLGDGIAPETMARQAAPRPSNPPSAAAPRDRPDVRAAGTQDERRRDPLKYKYFFGPYRKITETLPQFTATNTALREGGKVVPRAGLRPLRRLHVCPEFPRIGA